jgi:hypothetical protein
VPGSSDRGTRAGRQYLQCESARGPCRQCAIRALHPGASGAAADCSACADRHASDTHPAPSPTRRPPCRPPASAAYTGSATERSGDDATAPHKHAEALESIESATTANAYPDVDCR